jgi:hypothetical protein
MIGMKNRSLAVSLTQIPYYPALRFYAETVGAAVLMTQLDYFFGMKDKKDGSYKFENGFYKFMEPIEDKIDENRNTVTGHEKYFKGDSWCECLNVTSDEFRTMFDKIGKRYPSATTYRAACDSGDPFQGKYYLSFIDRKTNLTWYLRNHQKVDAVLDKIFVISGAENCSKPSKSNVPHSTWQNPSTVNGKTHPLNWQNPSTELANTCLHSTEITTEITSEITTTSERAILAGSCSVDLIFPAFLATEIEELRQLVCVLPEQSAQDILDEIEGYRRGGKIKTGPIPLAQTLIRALNKRTFQISKGVAVKSARAADARHLTENKEYLENTKPPADTQAKDCLLVARINELRAQKQPPPAHAG